MRRRFVSGGGRAGKPRCRRGQGLRRSALRGRAGEGTAGGQFVSRGDAGTPGSAQALLVTGLGFSPRPGTPAHRLSPGRPDGRRPGSGVRRPGATRRGRSVTQFPPGARGSICPRPPAAQHLVSPAAAGAALLARRPQASGLGIEGCQGPCAFQASFGTCRARWMRPFPAVS